jgi:hypothetical protein
MPRSSAWNCSPRASSISAFDDLMLPDRKDGLWAEQARIKDSAEVYIRPRMEEPEYSWIVAGLAEDMARNAEAEGGVMDKELKAKWVAALRSGEYKQGVWTISTTEARINIAVSACSAG